MTCAQWPQKPGTSSVHRQWCWRWPCCLVRWACWPWRAGAFCGPWPRCVQAWNALAQAISPTCHACRAVAISTTWGRHCRKWRTNCRHATRRWPKARPASGNCQTPPLKPSSCTKTDASPMRTRPLTASWALRPEGWWARPCSPGSPPPFWSAPFNAPRRAWKACGKWSCRMHKGKPSPANAAYAAASWTIARCAWWRCATSAPASRPRPKSANWPISTH